MELLQYVQTQQTNDWQHTRNHLNDSGNAGPLDQPRLFQLKEQPIAQHDDRWIDTSEEKHRQGQTTTAK